MINRLDLDVFRRIERFLWAAVLVALPVTSFRYLPFMGGDTQVKPLSLIPAVLLLLALLLRSLRERRLVLWNNGFQPLLVFILVAAAASAAGFLLTPVNLYSYTYPSRMIRAWLSLGVGLIFLITSVCMSRDEQDLKFTIKWIYVGLVFEMVWSLVQLFEIFIYPFPALDALQKTVMMAGLPTNNRISGLALEPSWLAAQVITLYLPWALAAVLKNYDIGIPRKWVAAILASCLFLLVFTYSRGGILITLIAVGLTCILAGLDSLQRAWKWFISPLKPKNFPSLKAVDVGLRIIVLTAILVSVGGGAFILSRNQYFAKLWQSNNASITDYFVNISAGPRLAYSWAGWTTFSQHPWTGVGMGAAGLYLIQALPDWAHVNILETALLLSPENQTYPNPHSLYIRLLSETGIFGFWSFIAFYLLVLGKILFGLRSKRKELIFLGTASLMAWLSIVMLGITLASFAMPIIWVPLGILIGISTAEKKSQIPRTPDKTSITAAINGGGDAA